MGTNTQIPRLRYKPEHRDITFGTPSALNLRGLTTRYIHRDVEPNLYSTTLSDDPRTNNFSEGSEIP